MRDFSCRCNDLLGNEIRRVPPSSIASRAQHPWLPLEMILYMAEFLNFEDYRSFIQALWPNGDESDIVREKLWKLSTHTFEATFLNGRRLDIEYNFDPARTKRNRVLINLDHLSPIFGGTMPSATDKFINISELYNFVEKEVHLNTCSNHQRACCPCHLRHGAEKFYGLFMKPSVDECERGHFHHFCWEHVISWLNQYLYTSILLQESKKLFDEEIAEQYSYFPEHIDYFQTGKRATPEFLLNSALEPDTAIYEVNDEYWLTTVKLVPLDVQQCPQRRPE